MASLGRGPRRWVRFPWFSSAELALVGAVVLYVLGVSYVYQWDLQEVCNLVHEEHFDLTVAYDTSRVVFPISQKCNRDYDIVPGYINPGIAFLLLVAISSLAAGVAAASVRRRTTDEGSETV
jgi:hypothetical protein